MSAWRKIALVLFLASLETALSDPCKNYTAFSGSDQRRPENKLSSGNAICDVSVITGWYRLKIGDADANLVVSTQNKLLLTSCSTVFPVYLTAKLPTTANTEVTLSASVAGLSTISVKVKICDSYNVYHLQPTKSCPTAYCFATNDPCPTGQSSENGRQPGCSANFPSITATPTVTPVIGNNDPVYEDLRFRCEFNRPGNDKLFYDVVWYVNEVEVKRFKSVSSNALPHSAELLEEHWFPRFKLGMNVVCGIRARFNVLLTPSPVVESPVFFAGIKVEGGTSIQLKQGETKSVKFRSTVPIPCLVGVSLCELRVRIIEVLGGTDSCTLHNNVGNCDIRIPVSQWSETQSLAVTGSYKNTYGNQLSRLLLHAVSPVPPRELWSDVQPAVVQINLLDLDVNTKGKFCRVHNDPHFKSFDSDTTKSFDVHQHGEFVLYRHKQLPLEVRGFFQKCREPDIHCICGAAVRSGPQLFVWSTCRDNINSVPFQTTRINVYGDCNKKQMRVTTLQGGRVFEVELPTGTRVKIETNNIYIYPSAADIDQVTGLCGNFNGDPTDEFIDKNGKLYARCEKNFCRAPIEYSLSWRIERDASYYNGLLVDQLGEPLRGHCRCEANKVVCESVPPKQCNPQHVEEVTDTYCTQLRRRKRRAVGATSAEDPVPIFPPDPGFTPNTNPQFRNGWTEKRAKTHCEAAFNRMPANAPCSRVPNVNNNGLILSCVQDILLTGDTEFTGAALEGFKLLCLTEVSRNTSLWTSRSGEVSILKEVLDNSCPNDCSSRGTCIEARCVCPEQAWIGPDCSVPAGRPPNITGLRYNGICDRSEHDCSQVTLFGEDFVKSDRLTCKFRQFVGAGAVLVNVTEAIFKSSSEIICPLNQSLSRPFNVYRLSVSNNNIEYGQELDYVEHEPCFNCSVLGNRGVCNLKRIYCYIDDECVLVENRSRTGKQCVKGRWTRWINRDRPSGNADAETVPINPTRRFPHQCNGLDALKVEARVAATKQVVVSTFTFRKFTPSKDGVPQVFVAGPLLGFQCNNKDQPNKRCLDYEHRLLCPLNENV